MAQVRPDLQRALNDCGELLYDYLMNTATDDYVLLHQIVEIASCGFHTTLVDRIGRPQAPQPPARAAKTSCFSLRHKLQCSAAKPKDNGFAGGDPIPTRCRRCEP